MAKEKRMGSVRIEDSQKTKMNRLLRGIDKSWKWFVLALPLLTFSEFEQVYNIMKNAYERDNIKPREDTGKALGSSTNMAREEGYVEAG